MNDDFGLPPVKASEPQDEKARVAALRAKAEAQAAAEFDEDAVFAKMLAEARAKRAAELLKEPVEFAEDTQGFPQDYDVVYIYPGANEKDPTYVPLGINGFVIKAPRDREIIVPHIFVTECLDHAIEEKTEPIVDDAGRQRGVRLRPVPRFQYRFIRKASTEEYQAFQQQQREQFQRDMRQAA